MTSPFTRSVFLTLAAALVLALAGCATAPLPPSTERVALEAIDPAFEQRLRALDPERVSAEDVRDTLARAPAPRVILLHGGVYPVHLLMESFARFLIGMGYPEERLRDVGDGSFSYSPYASSEQQAGMIAWYYEREGLRPILIGHSQGGIQAVKLLHELDGAFNASLRVYDPLTGRYEDRTTIVDPLTRQPRPVVGLSVAAAAVVGTGGWSLALPVHWNVATRIRTIPDTVDEFTGYRIGVDFFAMDVPGLEGLKTFHPNGTAVVRNVQLPAAYSHVFVPGTEGLLQDPAKRAWIDSYVPDDAKEIPEPEGMEGGNIAWAADVWHMIKKHWVLELQRALGARRDAGAGRRTAP
jgi:hypothetical protein